MARSGQIRPSSDLRQTFKKMLRNGRVVEVRKGQFKLHELYVHDLEFMNKNPDVMSRDEVLKLLDEPETIPCKILTTVLDNHGGVD